MSSIVLNKDMGAAILNRLKEFTDLPQEGFVAGQSVASAISELYGDGRAVKYTDVDLFKAKPAATPVYIDGQLATGPQVQKESTRVIATTSFYAVEAMMEYGHRVLKTDKRYSVSSTCRKGMLNEINCFFGNNEAPGILPTFDLNCVQAGVDIATSRLFWTADNERFLKTHQLDVVSLHTPFHSLVRYFRKKQELEGIYGNDARMLELAAAAYLRQVEEDGTITEHDHLRWQFGSIYKEKLDSVSSFILPHFELSETIVKNYTVYNLKPRHTVGQDILSARVHSLANGLPLVSRALREKRAKGTQACVDYLLTKPLIDIDSSADNERVPVPEVKGSALKRAWFVGKEDFLKGNISSSQMTRMDKLMAEHHIEPNLMKSTLELSWKAYLAIHEQRVKHGLWVYGALERNFVDVLDADSFARFIEEQKLLLSQTLKTKSLPDTRIGEFAVRELVTGMELVEEGLEMRHCVGGYAGRVKSKQAVIASFRRKNHANFYLTAEFHPSAAGWKTHQVKGLQNRKATEEETAATDVYAAYLTLSSAIGCKLAGSLVQRAPVQAATLGSYLLKHKTLYKLFDPQPVKKLKNLAYQTRLASSSLALRHGFKYGEIRDKNGSLLHPVSDVTKFWPRFVLYKVREMWRNGGGAATGAQMKPLPSTGAHEDDMDSIPF